ncbi:TetR family transcriptional regulator [Streptomyces sp. NPDC046805]|uniref:acyl-CoA-like ligand-binding transcription factor n=1 Tax=Streptomyces sp. NPDC046805 TaxID=3155134 RepID=UPI0033FF9BF6
MTNAPGLAQRKRQFVRDELARETLRLLATQGYEATTVEQVTDAVGVSRRTFFRYFQSKEDVIVQAVTDKGAVLAADFEARPADEAASAALHHALTPLVNQDPADPERMLRLTQLILRTPALHGRYLERQAQWKTALTSVLAQRTGRAATDMGLQLAAGMTLVAFHTALTRWADGDGTEILADLFDEAFTLVAPAVDAIC